MYSTNNGAHSYSTPASPNAYCTSHSNDGKTPCDKDLAALFRATAANVTQLYKEASNIGQSAYKAGYEQCYSDIWEFVLAAQADGTLATSPGGQQLLQQLIEFARMKRMSPRQTRFGTTNENRLSPTADHAHDSNRPSTGACDEFPPHISAVADDTAVHSSNSITDARLTQRAKRGLEPFESMDIEPPRRRQRRDDIEME
ncbi:hypothetical protein LPJ76_000319 [Coemansia sp. RSA 638]|nr:hypothetical protein LPJ76_000319 [Coemansia sp. RSA 638]KAJ2665452.1 hypothetical protein IW148_001572 [Coemansia sp. RSA 1199]